MGNRPRSVGTVPVAATYRSWSRSGIHSGAPGWTFRIIGWSSGAQTQLIALVWGAGVGIEVAEVRIFEFVVVLVGCGPVVQVILVEVGEGRSAGGAQELDATHEVPAPLREQLAPAESPLSTTTSSTLGQHTS
jgi:hypothetical protein